MESAIFDDLTTLADATRSRILDAARERFAAVLDAVTAND